MSEAVKGLVLTVKGESEVERNKSSYTQSAVSPIVDRGGAIYTHQPVLGLGEIGSHRSTEG